MVIPSRVINIPMTFINLMIPIFNQYLDQVLIAFINDIVVFSKVQGA